MPEAVAPRSTAIKDVVISYEADLHNFSVVVKDLLRNSPGYLVYMTVVNDDAAPPSAKEKEGMAGTSIVLRITGAATDQCRHFEEVGNIAETAARSFLSFGLALEPCTTSGHAVDIERLSVNGVELGMRIH